MTWIRTVNNLTPRMFQNAPWAHYQLG